VEQLLGGLVFILLSIALAARWGYARGQAAAADPSPLVRDSVRGWRTGRLDRVLAGDFDLMLES
jgi:hypothetical protein